MQELSPVTELDVGVYGSKTENCFGLYLQVERNGLFFLLTTEIFLMRNNSESGLKNYLWGLGNKFGL